MYKPVLFALLLIPASACTLSLPESGGFGASSEAGTDGPDGAAPGHDSAANTLDSIEACGFARSGAVADGNMAGWFDFGDAEQFPVDVEIDALARNIDGSFGFQDGSATYSAQLDAAIAEDGSVSGYWWVPGSGLEGTIEGYTNNETFCGAWTNDAGQRGTVVVERPSSDYCYYLPTGSVDEGTLDGIFVQDGAEYALRTEIVDGGDTLLGTWGSGSERGEFEGTIDGLGVVTGRWDASGASGKFFGTTDGDTFCGHWQTSGGADSGELRVKRSSDSVDVPEDEEEAPPVDDGSPDIFNVEGGIWDDQLIVWWSTSEPTTTEFVFDAYGWYGDLSTFSEEHSMAFTIDPSEIYYFYLIAEDVDGNITVSDWYEL